MEALTIERFGFSYPEGEAILYDIDWHVEDGSFVLLVGGTGSGKTTLLRSLKPEIAPVGERTGRIEVFGRALAYGPHSPLTADVGYVFQDPGNQIVCDTVWHELAFGLENLGVSPDAMRRRVAEVAHFFGIEPWIRRQTNSLSGGQKQMLNLAAVLAMHPKLLLLDEPTSQLDPVAEKNFLHALFRINRELGVTIIVATHAPEAMIDYATDCVRLEGGRLQAIGLAHYRIPPAATTFAAGKTDAASLDRRVADEAVGIDEVFFRFDRKDDYVLRGASLSLGGGAIHAVVGGNGSGKTTLLHLIAGACKPEHGKIRNGFSGRQALLPQDPKALFVCDSVQEELGEWKDRCGYGDDDVVRTMDEFGFASMATRHPYDLSGGQQQKLALAKLLLTDPDLYLLDEPTKGLDGPSRMDVAEILSRLRESGKTVIIVTHDLSFTLRMADTVSMLFDGEVACTQSSQEFFEENLFYRPLYDSFARLWDARSAS